MGRMCGPLIVCLIFPAVREGVVHARRYSDSFQQSAKLFGSKASSHSVGVCNASASLQVDKCRGKHKGLWMLSRLTT